MLKLLSTILLFILLNACSSVHNIGVVYHNSFDFSQVKNYSLYHRNSAFTDSQSLIDIRRNAIEIAIEGNMSNKKCNYSANWTIFKRSFFCLLNDLTSMSC